MDSVEYLHLVHGVHYKNILGWIQLKILERWSCGDLRGIKEKVFHILLMFPNIALIPPGESIK